MATPENLDLGKLNSAGSYFIEVEAGADTSKIKAHLDERTNEGYAVLRASADKTTPRYIFETVLENYPDLAKKLRITPPAKLEATFVLAANDMLAKGIDAKGSGVDTQIFSSMIGAVKNFLLDSLSQREGEDAKTEPYQMMREGDFNIEVIHPDFSVVAVSKGYVDERLKADLQKTYQKINEKFRDTLLNWNGRDDEVAGIEEILKENLFDTQKYTGEHDIPTLKQLREQRRWKALDAIEKLAKEKKILLCLDNLEDLDSATIEDLYHIARNAKQGNFVFVGTYHTDSVKDEPENKNLQKVIDKLKEEKLCETYEIKSQQSVYDILPHISENAKKVLQLAALGATGSALLKASSLNTADFANAYIELQGKRLLVDDRVATRKLASKVAEEVTDEKTYLAVAKAIEDANKDDVGRFAGVLSDLYSKTEEKGKAAEWARTAAENAIRNADLVNALKWYRKLADVAINGKERLDSLEKVIELGFHQLSGGLSEQETDIDRLENLALEENDLKRQAVAKLRKGMAYIVGRRFDEALTELEKAANLFSDLGETDLRTDALYARGVALNKQLHFNEARACFETILATTNDKRKKIKALSSIGYGHIRKGDLLGASSPETIIECGKAIGYFEESLKLADTIDDLYLKTNTLSNLAAGYVGIREFSKAKEYAEKAIELCKGAGNLLGVSQSLITIGYLEGELGNLEQGLKANEEAIEIAGKIGAEVDSPRANKIRIFRKMANRELRKISNPQFLAEVEKIKVDIDSEEAKIISAKKEQSKK